MSVILLATGPAYNSAELKNDGPCRSPAGAVHPFPGETLPIGGGDPHLKPASLNGGKMAEYPIRLRTGS
jgi:hypothetical protein